MIKVTQNQYYGKDSQVPFELPVGSSMFTDTGRLYFYPNGKKIEVLLEKIVIQQLTFEDLSQLDYSEKENQGYMFFVNEGDLENDGIYTIYKETPVKIFPQDVTSQFQQGDLSETNPTSNSFVNNKFAEFIQQTNPNISGANLQEALTSLYNDLTSLQDSINTINNGNGSQLAYSYSQDFNDPKASDTVKKALDRIITQVDGGLF